MQKDIEIAIEIKAQLLYVQKFHTFDAAGKNMQSNFFWQTNVNNNKYEYE